MGSSKGRVVSFVFNEFTNDVRVYKQCKSLLESGFEVLVAAVAAAGLANQEVKDGIKIRRLWISGIPVLPFQLMLYWIQCIWLYRKEKILHCNDLYALPIGAAIKVLSFRKAKLVYDCHEHETEAHVYFGKPILKRIAQFVERSLIGFADEVICVSQPIARAYSELYGIREPTLVLNCPELIVEPRKNLFREKFKISADTKIVLFQGEYRKGRGLEVLVEGFEKFNDPRVACVFIGYGPETPYIEEAARRSKNIFIHPTVPSGAHMDYVRSADVGVHLMENTCLNHYYALPNKLFEYAMAGIPVLVSNMLEMGRLTREHSIGFVLNDNTPDALVEQLKEIAVADLKVYDQAVDQFRRIYNWETQRQKFVALYQGLIEARA